MKKKLLTLLGGALLGLFSMNATAAVTWTDVTEKITNPSFESDEGSSNLTSTTTDVTGWTKTQGTPSNSQWGVAKSNCTIQAIATSMPTADGGNYYYIRCNWNADVHYGISQSIAELPAGMYKLSYKAATYSSSWSKSVHTVSLIESDGATSTKTMYNTGTAWTDFETWIFKASDESTLTIKVDMLAGAADQSQHYQLLVDDFKLFYCADLGATASNPVDVTAFISNPTVNNTNKGFVPRGWTAGSRTVGNTNYTEGTGNTRLEAWSGGNMNFDYYQTLNGLPNGVYTLSAKCQDTNGKGGKLYATAGSATKTVGMPANESTITTEKITVSDGSLRIGIKSATTSGGSWMTGDDFVLTFLGYDATEALAALAEQIAAATFTEKHSAASESALQTAIAAAQAFVDAGEGTKAEIETASSNLAVAVAAVNTSIADYAALHAAIAAASYAVITPSYTALATAITTAQGIYNNGTAESCADAIAALDAAVKAAKVADYSYVTTDFSYPVELGDWIKTGDTGENTGQHWSDDSSRKYLEQSSTAWGKSAWSLSYNQNVKLPAGDYVFKVAGRKSSGNCTLELVVKNGEETLGTVNDFPQGDVGLGINKAGATSFDPDDTEGFAYNGAGRGFQWRYVKFTLAEDATINVAVSASASEVHQWVSFCDATVQTNSEANIAMIAYNIALNDAKNALAADAYENVVTAAGKEYGDLDDLINADPGTTKAEIEAATAELKATTQAFKDAAPSYDDYYAAKAEAVGELPYATADKYAALQSSLTGSPASAADAVTKAAAIRKANRAYVESNSVAEGIEGIDWSELVNNTDFVADLEGWTSSQSGGNLQQMYSESPVDSYDFAYCYYDYYNNSANNQHASQTISKLPVGKYMLSVMARADANLNGVFIKFGDQQTEVSRIGASGGVFGRGWNIYTVEYSNEAVQNVTIEVYSTSTGGNKGGWFGFTRVRLIKIQDYATMSIKAKAEWGTFAAPFDVTLPDGVEAYTVKGIEGNALMLSDAITGTLPAFTAALVYKEGGLEPVTFSGKATDQTGTSPISHCLVGVFQPTKATAGHYVLMLNSEDKAVFGKVVEDDEPTVGANRCYLNVPSGTSSTILRFGDATGIQSMEQQGESVIYDLTGRRVDAAVKGIYIVGGKKMLVR